MRNELSQKTHMEHSFSMNKFAALNIKQPSDILFNYCILGELESCVCWAFCSIPTGVWTLP